MVQGMVALQRALQMPPLQDPLRASAVAQETPSFEPVQTSLFGGRHEPRQNPSVATKPVTASPSSIDCSVAAEKQVPPYLAAALDEHPYPVRVAALELVRNSVPEGAAARRPTTQQIDALVQKAQGDVARAIHSW